MDRKQLIDVLAITLLWEGISSYVEEPPQLCRMLKKIHYQEDIKPFLERVTRCEVLDSEPLEIVTVEEQGEYLLLSFEMPFLLSVWIGKKQVLRVTAEAFGTVSVPDVDTYDWQSETFEALNKQELLVKRNLLKLVTLSYKNIECDHVLVTYNYPYWSDD